jgi:hypothetical protein
MEILGATIGGGMSCKPAHPEWLASSSPLLGVD